MLRVMKGLLSLVAVAAVGGCASMKVHQAELSNGDKIEVATFNSGNPLTHDVTMASTFQINESGEAVQISSAQRISDGILKLTTPGAFAHTASSFYQGSNWEPLVEENNSTNVTSSGGNASGSSARAEGGAGGEGGDGTAIARGEGGEGGNARAEGGSAQSRAEGGDAKSWSNSSSSSRSRSQSEADAQSRSQSEANSRSQAEADDDW